MHKAVARFLVALNVVCWTPGGRSTVQAGPPPADGINVQTFDVAVSAGRYVTVYGAQTPGHLAYGVGFLTSYQRRPFVLHVSDEGDPLSGQTQALVDNLAVGQLWGFIGVTKYLSIGLSMPLGLYVTGTLPGQDPTDPGSDLSRFAWGDVGLHVQGFFYRIEAAHVSLGGVLSVTAPTGRYSESFLGEKNAVLIPRLTAEFSFGPWAAAANLGGVFRPQPVSFYDGAFEIGQQFSYGLAGSYMAARILRIIIELTGRTDFQTLEGSPMEAGLAARVKVYRGLSVEAGANAGILAGIGAPQFRVYAGLRWVPIAHDTDGDGVDDDLDKCPGSLEDNDGFEDNDGCPDLDNDKDLIPDTRDRCPNQPEDYDNYQDEDGCPEPDNDKDGVCDGNATIQAHLGEFAKQCKGKDNCPMNKGPAASGGCPGSMLDEDGDSVPDSRDKCPKRVEDKDGFEDNDGCPDPDNDKDGLCDVNEAIQSHLADYKNICHGKDKCSNLPEDKDSFEDKDGCPDPDDDKDGVCDDNPQVQQHLSHFRAVCIGRDRCPGKRETINGKRDKDGCPDHGKADAVLEGNQIILHGKGIRFEGTTNRFTKTAGRILDQIAAIMRAHREIKKIVVVGFTDSLMSKTQAQTVSESWAQAVARALVERGIAKSRIMAKGLGSAKPRYTGRSRRKQLKRNRRIELFVIR